MRTIKITSLCKRLGGEQLFDGMSLTAETGEIIGIRGTTGTGKTTLLRCIAGLEDHSGTVETDGDISYLFQEPRMPPWMDVRSNILLPLKLQGQEVTDNHLERMNELARRLDVDAHLEKEITEVSGGQQQRILQIRALINDPDIVLMDEPFRSLDESTREQAYEEVLGLCREEGRTVVTASHQPEMENHVDRVIDLHQHPGATGAR